MKTLVAALTALALGAGLALAQDGKAEIEAVMAEYLKLWNAHDAKTITARIYRLDESHPWSTEAGLAKEFERLKGQGYSHSDTHGIRGCITGPDAGQVELRFTRLKTDGGFMPPKDRLSIYKLKKFPDGWRVVGLGAGDPVKGMECPPSG
jgi:hypothetical protein